MLEDLVILYEKDDELCKEIARTVMREDNVKNHFEMVIGCLTKLPCCYLDRSIVGYGEAHSEESEFSIRVKYIQCNGNIDDEVKGEIMKACDVSELNSEELKELEELDILDDEEMVEMYGKALKNKEEEEEERKKCKCCLIRKNMNLITII